MDGTHPHTRETVRHTVGPTEIITKEIIIQGDGEHLTAEELKDIIAKHGGGAAAEDIVTTTVSSSLSPFPSLPSTLPSPLLPSTPFYSPPFHSPPWTQRPRSVTPSLPTLSAPVAPLLSAVLQPGLSGYPHPPKSQSFPTVHDWTVETLPAPLLSMLRNCVRRSSLHSMKLIVNMEVFVCCCCCFLVFLFVSVGGGGGGVWASFGTDIATPVPWVGEFNRSNV